MTVVATGYDEVVDLSDMVLVTAFKRAATKPATPTGQAPAGWYINAMPPAGPGLLWSSMAYADPVNLSIITTWGEPDEAGSSSLNEATAAEIAAAVPTYAPRYLGPVTSTSGLSAHKSDFVLFCTSLVQGVGDSDIRVYDGVTWAIEDPPTAAHKNAAQADILNRATFRQAGVYVTILQDQWVVTLLASIIRAAGLESSNLQTDASGVTRGMKLQLNLARILTKMVRIRGETGDGAPLSLGPALAPTFEISETGNIFFGSWSSGKGMKWDAGGTKFFLGTNTELPPLTATLDYESSGNRTAARLVFTTPKVGTTYPTFWFGGTAPGGRSLVGSSAYERQTGQNDIAHMLIPAGGSYGNLQTTLRSLYDLAFMAPSAGTVAICVSTPGGDASVEALVIRLTTAGVLTVLMTVSGGFPIGIPAVLTATVSAGDLIYISAIRYSTASLDTKLPVVMEIYSESAGTLMAAMSKR